MEMQRVNPAGGQLLVPSSGSVLGLTLFNTPINDSGNGAEGTLWNLGGEVDVLLFRGTLAGWRNGLT